MTFRWYVIFMGLGTGLAWIAWAVVLFTMNPFEAGVTGLLFFYLTLCLAGIGTLALFGLVYRIGIRKRSAMLTREVRISFRHAMLLSFVGVGALWLSSHHSLTWYWCLALILVAAAVEYVFMSMQESRRQ